MRSWREPLAWLAIGAIGAALLVLGYPRAFPLAPERWEVGRGHAEAIALERLRALGDPVEDAYVVVSLRTDPLLERLLQTRVQEGADARPLRVSLPGRMQVGWSVQVYRPTATTNDWTYRAQITFDGEVLTLLRAVPAEQGEGQIDEAEAQEQARRFVTQQGFDAERFEPAPEIERNNVGKRTDLVLRYRERAAVLGPETPYGLEVRFAGEQLAGFAFWLEEGERGAFEGIFRQAQLVSFGRVALFYLLLPFVVVPFLKRYHDGQLGVRRGVQLLVGFLALGLFYAVLCAQQISTGVGLGFVTRQQTTWMVVLFTAVFNLLGLATLALASWSVGESLCRERWAHKLAAMDAFFRLKWRNATFARSALRGLGAGLGVAGLMLVASVPLQRFGGWSTADFVYDGALASVLPGPALVAGSAAFLLPSFLFAALFVPAWGARRLGRWGLLLALALAPFVVQPFLVILPLEWGLLLWVPAVAVPILLFWFGDLLSALLAALTAIVSLGALPLVVASDPWLELNGWLALALLAVPLAISLRELGSDHEFVYLYDDVPPHVRRIAERERQRVELETARNIQSSILPELPEQLAGVEIAHAYLPASEVGGDFYDVLALEDGRLALAVGDVAGHGVASGLVMSAAKSALAVQVTFDPRVESVFATLNRMVHQSARRRLLTTLCYALLDPKRRELLYASAGHLYPYRVSTEGRVEALESIAYPLGVRDQLEVRSRLARLEPGDSLFFYSDGLVEAHAETSEEPFGFERLEASLTRHAGKAPAQLRDGVLGDVTAFVGHARREDDMTVLVARLPER